MQKTYTLLILFVFISTITSACKTSPAHQATKPVEQHKEQAQATAPETDTTKPQTATLQPGNSTGQKGMATEQHMRTALQAYIDNFNAKDGQALAALFADNARIEDPVGGGKIVEGRSAVDEFYRGAVEVVDRLELAAPIRASHGDAAAMAFDIHMKIDGRPMIIRAIDVMTFNADGKIIDMKAYHGPGDVSIANE